VSEFVEVCALGDLSIDRPRRVMVGSQPIAVVRTDEGIFAIDDRCSHADVALSDGEVEGCAIECWLHGSAFDLRTGVPLSLPATVPVPIHAVRVEGEGDAAVVLIDAAPLPVH
jgi:3-phenylpropionate/trans-cinnamate dioxygenase ferredoxin subunit